MKKHLVIGLIFLLWGCKADDLESKIPTYFSNIEEIFKSTEPLVCDAGLFHASIEDVDEIEKKWKPTPLSEELLSGTSAYTRTIFGGINCNDIDKQFVDVFDTAIEEKGNYYTFRGSNLFLLFLKKDNKLFVFKYH